MGASWAKWTAEEEECVKKLLKNSTRKINILVVGLSGSGKSAFISSMQSCLTHLHDRELAVSIGSDNGGGDNCVRRYQLTSDVIRDVDPNKLPVFYESPGFGNFNDEDMDNIMRMIIRGGVPLHEDFKSIYHKMADASYRAQWLAETIENDAHKIDRLVFVHSCEAYYPENLSKLVIELSRELNIPVFSVLSFADSCRKMCTEEEIEMALGTQGTPRGCKVELYHKDKSQHGRYADNQKTNYYLLLMWKALLNDSYVHHSK